MKLFTAFLFALLLPALAQAQTLPDTFIVTGVAADDVLNIRAEPTASAPIVGELGPYMINIEVLKLSANQKWGRVSTGEGNGWASMRYLERSGHNDLSEVPRPMTCIGTEPFWALGMHPQGDEYVLLGYGRHDLTWIKDVLAFQGFVVVFEEGPSLNRTLTVERGLCSDGMSDRDYGWRATLLNEAPDGDSLQFGCCTLDHR